MIMLPISGRFSLPMVSLQCRISEDSWIVIRKNATVARTFTFNKWRTIFLATDRKLLQHFILTKTRTYLLQQFSKKHSLCYFLFIIKLVLCSCLPFVRWRCWSPNADVKTMHIVQNALCAQTRFSIVRNQLFYESQTFFSRCSCVKFLCEQQLGITR